MIRGHIDKGEQVILLTDINENVQSNNIQQWAESLSIEEIVNKTTDHPIATLNCGSSPIDGIFTSNSISCTAAGYLGFGEFQSDHRGFMDGYTQASNFWF